MAPVQFWESHVKDPSGQKSPPVSSTAPEKADPCALLRFTHLASPMSEPSPTGSSSRSQSLRLAFSVCSHGKSQERPWAAASQPTCSQISDTPKTQEIKRFERFDQLGSKGEPICYLQTGLHEHVIIGSTEVFLSTRTEPEKTNKDAKHWACSWHHRVTQVAHLEQPVCISLCGFYCSNFLKHVIGYLQSNSSY